MAKTRTIPTLERSDVLLVGDWVVDAYWYLADAQSDTSFHVGREHYRRLKPSPGLHDADEIIDLCGAGHVARSLIHLHHTDELHGKVWAVGNWDSDDEEILYHLFHSPLECGATRPGFGLGWKLCNAKRDPALELIRIGPDRETSRIFRLYRRQGAKTEQLCRIDSEEPLVIGTDDVDQLSKLLPPSEQIGSIIVVDLMKGVVTPRLVSMLSTRYPAARWFIRSKDRKQTCFRDLESPPSNVDLVVRGHEVVVQDNPLDTWVDRGGMRLTRAAWEVLSSEEFKVAHSLVILTEQQDVLARFAQSHYVIAQSTTILGGVRTQVGWPTAFFARLAALGHERASRGGSIVDFTRADIEAALNYAPSMSGELRGQGPNVATMPKLTHAFILGAEVPWKEEAAAWNAATLEDPYGIIRGGEWRLDVWRGSTDLPGYVCCVDEKRNIIRTIGSLMRRFQGGSRRDKALSILLMADPGSGKTTLVNALGKAMKLRVIQRNLAQMLARDELLDTFDSISTAQAQGWNDVLVFIDEINMDIGGTSAYGSFLAPLEEGTYVRKGQTYEIKPCVWIFVGTPAAVGAGKYEDFATRMAYHQSIDYRSLVQNCGQRNDMKERIKREAKLEQIYIGASLIHHCHPGVEWVKLEILHRFYLHEPLENPARRIRRQVEQIRNVRNGRIALDSWTYDDAASWADKDPNGDRDVRLIF